MLALGLLKLCLEGPKLEAKLLPTALMLPAPHLHSVTCQLPSRPVSPKLPPIYLSMEFDIKSFDYSVVNWQPSKGEKSIPCAFYYLLNKCNARPYLPILQEQYQARNVQKPGTPETCWMLCRRMILENVALLTSGLRTLPLPP